MVSKYRSLVKKRKKESTAVKLKASDYVGLPKKKESTAVNLKAVPTESGCLKMHNSVTLTAVTKRTTVPWYYVGFIAKVGVFVLQKPNSDRL